MNPSSTSEPKLKLRERLRTATRDAILDAAAEVFAADGAANARVEDIASRAGVAVGTVYNYFEDRAALIAALLELRTRSLLDALDTEVALPRAAGRERVAEPFQASLRQFVAALAQHFDSNRGLLTVLLEERLAHGMAARDVSRRETVLEEIVARAERLMTKGLRSHALRKGDPKVYGALLVGMVRGVATSWLAGGDLPMTKLAPEITEVFLQGAGR